MKPGPAARLRQIMEGGRLLKYERDADSVTVKLKGELDHRSAERVRMELDELISDRKVKRLILDVSGLEFMDSSGIGVILGRYRMMQKRGGRVCVKNGNPQVNRILEVAGLYRVVDRMK